MPSPIMGCMCCCFKPPRDEEPSSLVKKSDEPTSGPRKSYGAITTQETLQTKPPPSPRKSPTELLYTEPPKSARVKSPETVTSGGDTSSSGIKSPKLDPTKSPENIKGGDNTSSSGRSPEKRTLAEIAEAAQKVTSAFSTKKKSRTSTPSPTVDNKQNAKTAEAFEERAVDVPLIPPGDRSSAHGSLESIESETCHSIGEDDEDEEESEDARILRMLPSVPPVSSPGGSQTHLVPKTSTSSPGSSTHDLSTGSKKQSKARDFMKKAGKNMKKAKKKVGKGMEKMIHHKKKEEDSKSPGNTKERADSSSANEASSTGQFKRVSSERMKSKYARDKLAALEKKREEEASQKSTQGFPDPRQAAMERGEKLGELEDKTEQMRDQAASFAHNVSLLKNRNASSS